jgi:hypothetical protein
MPKKASSSAAATAAPASAAAAALATAASAAVRYCQWEAFDGVVKVATQVHPSLTLSPEALAHVNGQLSVLLERLRTTMLTLPLKALQKLSDEADVVKQEEDFEQERKTNPFFDAEVKACLNTHSVQESVRLLIPGALRSHAVAEGTKVRTECVSHFIALEYMC